MHLLVCRIYVLVCGAIKKQAKLLKKAQFIFLCAKRPNRPYLLEKM